MYASIIDLWKNDLMHIENPDNYLIYSILNLAEFFLKKGFFDPLEVG